MMTLPSPRFEGRMTLEKALSSRRSVRSFRKESMDLTTLAQLLWSAQGLTQAMEAPSGWSWGHWQGGKRTAPSAGALYPLEVYVIVGDVDGLKPAVYSYVPQSHKIRMLGNGDRRVPLAEAAQGQEWIAAAPCAFVIGAVYQRTQVKYGERGIRYVHIEAGHAVQNICLQAVALGLGSTVVGAFRDEEVKGVVGIPTEVQPLLIVPVGKPAEDE